MAKLPSLILAITLAVCVVSSAAELGSVVSSFTLRPCWPDAATSGMTYANGFLWTLQIDSGPPGATIVKRVHPTGSILASYKISPDELDIFEELTYDGNYFWAGRCTVSWQDPKLLKIDAGTMSIVSSVPLNWFENEIVGLDWNGQDFWFSYFGAPNETYRMTTSGSVVASYPIRYDFSFGIAYAPGLAGGARVFECHRPGGSSTRINVYKAAGHKSEYSFLIQRERPCRIFCWDGEYLWLNESLPTGENACRVVAWPPDIGVEPASLGKVKAVFR